MTLTIQDLGALGELLGSVAVLATLVYLALQTRQNTMAIGAQIDATRLGTQQTLNLLPLMYPELRQATSDDLVDDLVEADQPLDHMLLHSSRIAALLWMQWSRFYARRGLVPTWNETAIEGALAANFRRYRSYAESWDRVKSSFHPEFVEWVEEQRSKAA